MVGLHFGRFSPKLIWSQSNDRELQRQRRKNYNATNGVARFQNKNYYPYFKNALLHTYNAGFVVVN
jgi:hypothetical protein